MAPRAYWKGYLRLSLVSCPISLFPASGENEKISFHQINSKTGNRIRYRKVDEETGEEVSADDIVKGYEVSKGEYVEITDKELEAISLESTRTIEIDQFVPRKEIDELYSMRPYYIAPNGKVGVDAFVIIRQVIEEMKMVAIGRVVLTSREHVIALEPRGKGIMGMLLRYPYEIRSEKDYFDDIPATEVDKEAMELAKHIVRTKSGHFDPEKFEDRYEAALRELIAKKHAGERIEAPRKAPAKVVNLMDALRRSVAGTEAKKPPAPRRKQRAKKSARKPRRRLNKAS
jgi:DNA end-binding protein Ku